MTHLSLPTQSARLLLDALTEIRRLLDPANRPAFGLENPLPLLNLPADFTQRLAAAEAAFNSKDYPRALREGRALLDALRAGLSQNQARDINPLAGQNPLSDPDIQLQQLLLPVLLNVIKKRLPGWVHLTVVLLLFADERLQEWYPQSFWDRWWDSLVVRGWDEWRSSGGGGEPLGIEQYWPNLVVDLLGPLVLFLVYDPFEISQRMGGFSGALKQRPRMDFWVGYGWEPRDPAQLTSAERVAERALTLWWEYQPEALYDKENQRNYELNRPLREPFRRFGLTWVPLLEEHGGPMIAPMPHGDWGGEIKLASNWKFTMEATNDAAFLFGRAAGALSYIGAEPLFSLGDADQPDKGLALVIGKGDLTVKADWHLAQKSANALDVALKLKNARLGLGSIGSNPLLSRLLPKKLNNTFTVGVGYNSKTGFYWEGGFGQETYVPVQSKPAAEKPPGEFDPPIMRALARAQAAPADGGPAVQIPHLRLAVNADKDQAGLRFALEAGLGLRLRLGPVQLSAEGLGGRLTLAYRTGADGNLGPLDLALAFTEPDRFGLIIDAGQVAGGGFLAHDPDNNRWLGALSLDIAGRALEGLVLSEGDSLLGIVWARGLNIPLLGGTVDGLGALLGCDRRGDRDAFLRGLRDNALDAVLFPADPVGSAPQLIATLSRLFPRAPDYTVLGVMAQWIFGGQARLVVAELGVLAEFQRSRLTTIYLLGQGRIRLARLPDHLFRLNIELFGALDFDANEFFIQLTLRDSRLVGGELSGGGLLYYSKAHGFIASLGGFNPRYPAPARLGTVARLTAHIADSEHLRIVYQAYVALTTTSFQLGGKLSLWAGAHGFAIEGMLSLDVLVRFDMEFFVDVAAVVAIKRGSRSLASIELEGTLSGISPWRLNGRARFKLLFFSVTIPVDFTFGGGERVSFEPTDALEPLLAALGAPANWRAAGRPRGVRLLERRRQGVWIDAFQAIRVSQAVVPLEQTITRLGASPLRQPQTFRFDSVTLGGEIQRDWTPVEEAFAPGLFQDLDPNEAIRAPQFEQMQAGLELAGDALKVSAAVDGGGEYEPVIVDDQLAPAAVAVRAVAAVGLEPAPPPPSEADFYRVEARPAAVAAPRFVVADPALQPAVTIMGVAAAAAGRGSSYAEARRQRREAWRRGVRCQVVRRYEIQQAAALRRTLSRAAPPENHRP